jgi:hypothetical protein
MLEYERKVGVEGKMATLTGLRCERCGFVLLSNDDDIWSSVGS